MNGEKPPVVRFHPSLPFSKPKGARMVRKNVKRPRLNSRRKRKLRFREEQRKACEQSIAAWNGFIDGLITTASDLAQDIVAEEQEGSHPAG